MSARYRSDPEALQYEEKASGCSNFLHYTWKTITCLFSHVTLVSMVVSYCVLGAFTFEALEANHEIAVKGTIKKIRHNTTNFLWNHTVAILTLNESEFTPKAVVYLKEFENALLRSIAKDGWNGVEDKNNLQWTTTGSLFYSIVVITTIGYGHITPKTPWGKVVTIFYAILGIPLMLLCLSNIGDIMATSFRFIYWRVCCYVCTRKRNKKTKRGKSFRSSVRTVDGRFSRSRNTSFRRSVRNSGKSADSGYAQSDLGHQYHSDTELRYPDEFREKRQYQRGTSLPSRPSRFSEVSSPPKKSTANQNRAVGNHVTQRGGSLDRRRPHPLNQNRDVEIELDPIFLANTPILCNRYVVGKNDILLNHIPANNVLPGITVRNMDGHGKRHRRAASMPKTSNYLEPPKFQDGDSSSDKEDVESIRSRQKIKPRRSKSPMPMGPSPKMMTPLGYGHKSKYLDDPDSDDDEYFDETSHERKEMIKPVPIWLCVLLVISYILAGAYLFKYWEGWDYLDSAYFCFVTLTTIGLGDFVPARGAISEDKYQNTVSIALCSLYLLFGISLLAMSFNLVQEEVIANVKSVAKTLGIIKAESDESEDED